MAARRRGETSDVLMTYIESLSSAMNELAADPRVLFLGQGVGCKGTFMSMTLEDVPIEKRIELPVAEEMQMGMSIGLSLAGYIPVSVYPRWNFLILAANQLVNHLDVLHAKVIIRVGIGSETPLHPGPQHVGNFSEAFRLMLRKTPVIELSSPDEVVVEYRKAFLRNGPSVMVEDANLY